MKLDQLLEQAITVSHICLWIWIDHKSTKLSDKRSYIKQRPYFYELTYI